MTIGFMPAWRALPAGVGGGLESASEKMDQLMKKPVLTPADATPELVQIQVDMTKSAAQAGAKGNPAAAGTTSGAFGALTGINAGLTATWTAASAVPGGQPAANIAYTQGIKAAAAVAASATMASVASMADTHICPIPCPIPPHGPGVVTQGSKTVFIDNLPAVRQGDEVIEACGGSDPIAMGCATVLIGDEKGSGGGGGGGGSGGGGSGGESSESTSGAPGSAAGVSGTISPTTVATASVEAATGKCTGECSNPACAEGFSAASESGTPLVDREAPGCDAEPAADTQEGSHVGETSSSGTASANVAPSATTVRIAP